MGERTNNASLIEPLLDDRITVTSDDGTVLVGKAAVLADAKATTWSTAAASDLKVTVFGETAIAIGTFAGTGRDAGGNPVSVRVRFTDTWVKSGAGKWLCVAGHDSPARK